MRIIIGSLSPIKSQAIAASTSSAGVLTFLEYIPSLLGSIATSVGIIASIIVIVSMSQQRRINSEKHEKFKEEKDRDKEKHEVWKEEKEIDLRIKSLEAEKLEKEINN